MKELPIEGIKANAEKNYTVGYTKYRYYSYEVSAVNEDEATDKAAKLFEEDDGDGTYGGCDWDYTNED